ncbi:PREDICTED: regulator of G-protein signaling 12 isoform X2 [Nanorana parkeri]|uniref:regulator of G-protein signaling 12 isoform X2 n=1 Tax=Nanorana parkeri TaxID=125878 RepID=UPI0008546AF0|nr:PREDICTED: regulator of G-protein signaling 12 isoform X2 [Nanorana parkeri]
MAVPGRKMRQYSFNMLRWRTGIWSKETFDCCDEKAATVSDGELNSTDLKGCVSENSLSSNASLPSVQSCRKLGERRVASWAVSFERLLQDPVGVRYFTEFLKKEFSEENILFWQACEYFSRVPAHDKNELSYRAREIFNKFLSSKATTPVNIDSQAQLADDILNAPHPDMFKEQQLQIFNLMKFDSYTRFLKSHLYQECMLAEVEGRSLPDPQEIPSSPTSKHSVSSDRSNISTPKKQLSKKTKSGRSLNEESGGEDDNDKRRKGTFFSWSRSKSIGKSQKKKENGDVTNDSTFINGGPGRRRESQGSVSSSASLEMINCGSNGNALEFESSRVSSSEKSPKHCYIAMPDGSSCAMVVKTGFSIKEILCGLCEKHGFNIAAVDLFLVGGNKPLVLGQDSSILESRDLRIEKRTLFRLDLVPINRSVGLKAKPTKPVTEVLRPVVAKYGLNLNELVARLSGEQEPLDLGVPISTLDGQRVVLEEKDGSRMKDKAKNPVIKSIPALPNSRIHTCTVEDRPLVKSASIRLRGEFGKGRDTRQQKKDEAVLRVGRKKQHKINLDEAEAFFEMISKAQSNRAEDQRGLLRKEDLVLPDFLRLSPPDETSLTPGAGQSSRKKMEKSTSLDKGTNGASRGFLGTKQDFTQNGADWSAKFSGVGKRDKAEMVPPSGRKTYVPFNPPLSPIPHVQDRRVASRERRSKDLSSGNIQTVEDDNVADLTLVAEGDISSPNSTLLPMPPTPLRDVSKLSEANFSPPPPCTASQDSSGCQRSGTRGKKKSLSRSTESFWEHSANSSKEKVANQCLLPAGRVIDVDGVKPSSRRNDSGDDVGNLSFEGYISELKTCKGRMRTGVYRTSDLPAMVTAKTDRKKESGTKYKATFV